MSRTELYYFAVDALLKVVSEDPVCIPLRRFFDQEVRVLTTMQCYDAALDAFLQDRIDKAKARSSFSVFLEKVELIEADSEETKRLMQKHALAEPGASLIAALGSMASSAGNPRAVHFLVTSDTELIVAAEKEGISFHDYSQKEFCEKYGS